MKKIRYRAPLYEALLEYSKSGVIPFHMPGHKMGKGLPDTFSENISKFDITEINGMDNLHDPRGLVKKSEALAAEAFGSRRAFFLVNGSTAGILASILYISNKGARLIVQRNSHKSVYNGMILAGVEPEYIMPGLIQHFGIPGPVSPNDVNDALGKCHDAPAVLITSPGYYGICSDIKEIAQIVHSYNKILIVDEAHGSHLRFSKELPLSAVESGADIVIQSAHKTLPALTQAAYLHIGGRINGDEILEKINMLQTTSPSYAIMSSLDLARGIMEQEGQQRISELLKNIQILKTRLKECAGVKILEDARLDGTRLVVNVAALGMTGYEAAQTLREKFNIEVEMADLYNMVFVLTISDSFEDLDKLSDSIMKLCKRYGKGIAQGPDINRIPEFNRKSGLISASKSPKTIMHMDKAAGHISGAFLIPYPPGIPLVCPGEEITFEVLNFIMDVINVGGDVNGVDENLCVKVIN